MHLRMSAKGGRRRCVERNDGMVPDNNNPVLHWSFVAEVDPRCMENFKVNRDGAV